MQTALPASYCANIRVDLRAFRTWGVLYGEGRIEEEVDRKFCLFIVQEFELFLRYAGSLWPTIKISIASCNSMDGPRRTTDEDG